MTKTKPNKVSFRPFGCIQTTRREGWAAMFGQHWRPAQNQWRPNA